MDYSFFGGPQQAYDQFLGMQQPFTHTGLDADTTTQSIEPLDSALYPTCYDGGFGLNHGLPTPHQGSPENIAAHTPMPVGSIDSGLGPDFEDGQPHQTRSSSEEKENLTPAQSRRKAQNRAAQRAFRERKERHVKELETKLSALESSTRTLQSDNDRLKSALHRARTENEILRATTGHSPASSRPVSASYPSPGAHLPTATDEDYDDDEMEMQYSVESLTHGAVVNSAGKEHSRTKGKGREVPAGKAWDLIQSHPLVKQGLVDVADVCERLKGKTKCDGHGPIFEESTIWQAVEESRRCGGDELI
ncbi:hypothetical protein ACET3X_005563 [Alternaria dauci]|uniref:BZIP domain-containing protein n=1 Tax=Alternaria dauci TaxID=48095 RepID=A0ABR3ULV2_9PLEO